MTGPAQSPRWMMEIDALLEALGRRGFLIGVDTTLRVHELLFRLSALGPLPANPHVLRTYLGPVLVRQRDQQPDFDELFHRWAASYTPAPAEADAESEPAETARARRTRSWISIGTVVLGTIAGGLFYWSGPRWPTESPWAFLFGGSDDAPALNALSQLNVTYGLTFLVVPLLMLFSWACFMVTRRLAIFARNVAVPTLTEPVRVGAPGEGRNRRRAMADHMRVFGRRRPRPGTELDIPATLQATVRAAGMPTPRHGLRQIVPEYLVLIERRASPDHLHRLGIELLEAMRSEGVFFSAYTFRETPVFRSLGNDRVRLGETVALAELSVRHAGDTVILISDGTPLNSRRSGRTHEWVRGFDAWPEKYLFTPVPASLWERMEANLVAVGIVPMHFNEPSLARMAAALKEARPISAEDFASAEPERATPLPVSLATDTRSWMEESRPTPTRVEQLVRELHAYLDPEGFRWLCACAAFPRLVPSLTLRVGAVLTGHAGGALADESRLLQLVRLPWFREGRMPQWLRLRLLAELDAGALDTITGEIHRLLAPSAGDRSGEAIHLAETARARADEHEEYSDLQPDRLFVDFATTRLGWAGAFPAPAAWYRYLNRSALRRTVVAATGLALGAAAAVALALQIESVTTLAHQFGRHARLLALPGTVAAVLMVQLGLVDWLVRACRRDSDRGLWNFRIRLGIWRPLGLHLLGVGVLAVDLVLLTLLAFAGDSGGAEAAVKQQVPVMPEPVHLDRLTTLAAACLGLGLAVAFQMIARPVLAVRPPLEGRTRDHPPLLDALIRHPRPWSMLLVFLVGMTVLALLTDRADGLFEPSSQLATIIDSVSWLVFWPGLSALVVASLQRRLKLGRSDVLYAFFAPLWLQLATIAPLSIAQRGESLPDWTELLIGPAHAFWIYAALAFAGERLRMLPLRDGLVLAMASASGAALNRIARTLGAEQILDQPGVSALFWDGAEAVAVVWLLRRYLTTSWRRLTAFFAAVVISSLFCNGGISLWLESMEADFEIYRSFSSLRYPLFLASAGAALYLIVLRPERKAYFSAHPLSRRWPELARPAGFFRRAFAGAIDAVLVLMLCSLFIGLGIQLAEEEPSGVLLIAALIALTTLYHVSFETSRFAGTPGKIVVGSMIVQEDGRRLSALGSGFRLFWKTIGGALLGLGFLPAAFGRWRTLHDYLASTRVVQRQDDA